MYRGKRQSPLPVRVRDELGELFADAQFAGAFGAEGKPGWSPGRLALITVFQRVENLTDRQAAEAVRADLSWKYALGLELDDPGFDASVLSEFRSRVVAHGLEELALDLLVSALIDKGMLKAGGKQRTDSTHVISAVRDLNRLELAGECVRAALEALSAAAPHWVQQVLDLPGWAERYRARIDSWRLPTFETKREELARAYGSDGYVLVAAVYAPFSPAWLRQLPAVDTLRVMLIQNYVRTTDKTGREVVKRRRPLEDGGEGLPPGRWRLTSPYDTDARWAAKGEDLFWNGYKVHISETCHTLADTVESENGNQGKAIAPPNLITNVATTDATVPDVAMTEKVHQGLQQRGLLPREHYVDSGYASAELIVSAREAYGLTLVTPVLLDQSPQARAQSGYDRSSFTVDWANQQVTCPQGQTSASWSPCVQRGTDAIVVTFPTTSCRPCPVRTLCTTSTRERRQLTLHPQPIQQALEAARAEQTSKQWQDKYKIRAGVEGTVRQAVAVTGLRRARYRGIEKVHLEHVFSAVALNLIRLDAWWNSHPLDRGRTSHLARLELAELALAA
ncbi:IS1182 family transposase [Sphaerisporangium perillae]|uniref:IS1182 family transposase n=1 Tax=Sphaerisporangium perillae TaxID=2935860 RepID=UPI0020103B2A|nr:IS1182 family transposase [Sphaerisporangium perillae]